MLKGRSKVGDVLRLLLALLPEVPHSSFENAGRPTLPGSGALVRAAVQGAREGISLGLFGTGGSKARSGWGGRCAGAVLW